MNQTTLSNVATRTGGIVKGFFSFSHSGRDKDGVVRSTISDGADINLRESKDLSDLNRDESKMTETTRDDDYTYSIGIPIVDFKELKEKLENSWVLHLDFLQQKSEDKSLPPPDKKLLEVQKEVIEVIKEEAIEEGFIPEDIQEAIEDIAREEFAAKNLEKLNEYHEGKEIPVEEVISVLEGKQPAKNEKGEIVFTEAPKDFMDYYLAKESLENTEIQQNHEAQKLYEQNVEYKPEAGIEPLCPECWIIDGPLKLGGFALKIAGKAGKKALGKVTVEGIKKGLRSTANALKKLRGSKVKVEVLKETKNVATKAEDTIKAIKKTGFHKHHSFPKFMGGKQAQKLVNMLKSQHIELHKDLTKFLKSKYPEMVTKRGYTGDMMKLKVPLDLRLQALKEFYSGPGAKYADVAAEFFKLIQ